MIETGVADPNRICIVGASYGGYVALEGVMKPPIPDLYRCAVSIAGVSDLPDMMREEGVQGRQRRSYHYWLLSVWVIRAPTASNLKRPQAFASRRQSGAGPADPWRRRRYRADPSIGADATRARERRGPDTASSHSGRGTLLGRLVRRASFAALSGTEAFLQNLGPRAMWAQPLVTSSPIASEEVRPGLSMPNNRQTALAMPSSMTKSPCASPGPCSLGRMPAELARAAIGQGRPEAADGGGSAAARRIDAVIFLLDELQVGSEASDAAQVAPIMRAEGAGIAADRSGAQSGFPRLA
ncbi:MAG: prolyl oligopeptidase family serine peptidase [Hyphomonadaceae bacterium]